jgi:hypothetical protein
MVRPTPMPVPCGLVVKKGSKIFAGCGSECPARSHVVIPAKAGIHFAASRWWMDGSRLSPG